MAIGPDGTVTTTGLMDNSPKIPQVPDMSNLQLPEKVEQEKIPTPKTKSLIERPTLENPNVTEKLNSLTTEEKQQLDMMLSPSLSLILSKIMPEASEIISQFTSDEENVVLPVSVVKNYARIKYPSSSEEESIQGFITELSESQPDNTNVPPENMQTSNPNSIMAKDPNAMTDTDAIDQGLV